MAMHWTRVIEEALALPTTERRIVFAALRHALSDFELSPAMIEELDRRVRSIEDGTAVLHTAEEVLRELRAKHGGDDRAPQPVRLRDMALLRWINDHNPADDASYAPGFWSYVEQLQHLLSELNADDIEVLGSYEMGTPPPCEVLVMPAVSFRIRDVRFALNYDFGVWPEAWTVGVMRPTEYHGETYGLFDEANAGRTPVPKGFTQEWALPAFANNRRSFLCQVDDDWKVPMLITIMAHDGGRAPSTSARSA